VNHRGIESLKALLSTFVAFFATSAVSRFWHLHTRLTNTTPTCCTSPKLLTAKNAETSRRSQRRVAPKVFSELNGLMTDDAMIRRFNPPMIQCGATVLQLPLLTVFP
jgi:hypothetical protein